MSHVKSVVCLSIKFILLPFNLIFRYCESGNALGLAGPPFPSHPKAPFAVNLEQQGHSRSTESIPWRSLLSKDRRFSATVLHNNIHARQYSHLQRLIFSEGSAVTVNYGSRSSPVVYCTAFCQERAFHTLSRNYTITQYLLSLTQLTYTTIHSYYSSSTIFT